MQLKGLVRFFTILLIIYSLYQLSFTWFVRGHENKLEKVADNYLKANGFVDPAVKYPSNKDSQAIYSLYRDSIKNIKMMQLKDSTKDDIITYGFKGGITYQKAKQEELNLGLDLQGGMNVTLEVEMAGLIKTLANNSTDPNFLKALDNATKRKANSDANFITLFVEEFKKLSPNTSLASIFSTANRESIKVTDSDDKVIAYLNEQSKAAFANTTKLLTTRIDKFGVSQPSINADAAKQIITVELPGVQDKERIRRNLQAAANLQFWEVYNSGELVSNLMEADKSYTQGAKPTVAAADSTKTDNAAVAANDTSNLENKLKNLAATSKESSTPAATTKSLFGQPNSYIIPPIDQQGQLVNVGYLGNVLTQDTATVRSILSQPQIRAKFPSEVRFMYGILAPKAKAVELYAIKSNNSDKAKLEGDVVTNASVDFDQFGKKSISLEMNPIGARVWADLTRANKGRHIAIVVDNSVYSAPVVNDVIEGGRSSISGNYSTDEATDLANILKIGKLPAPAKIVAEQTVGPTLGESAIKGGFISFALSFLVIFILMLVYYNTSGWIANIALVLNLLFTIGVLAGLGGTLTAAGIAGLVLTIGMAVDVNVLIYERIKEELAKGKSHLQAIKDGYHRSFAPVFDGHITSLITAVILFYFGLGPVKGFATTQILGLLLSLFCGILVSRWVTTWFTNKNHHLKYYTPISKKIFKHSQYRFVENKKYAYMISIVVIILGLSTAFFGFDYGVEFEGGRSYQIRFKNIVSVEQVRDDLQKVFDGESPVIKTIDNASKLDITTAYLINDPNSNQADSIVQHRLFEGLKNHLPTGLSYQEFASDEYKIGSKKILPTISDDLKRGAVYATILSIFAIFLYIFIRFRDWKFSLGTIFSLLHDALVMLIVFSFLRKIVPFPLEIDQHFIAAILTVIGFSMNDTVVVFDRIRENTKLHPGLDEKTIINRSINETLSRTIMTSLTVFLTVLILFIFGGEVTRGFAFAMLIGVVTGVYSSIFVAAPVLVDLKTRKERANKK